MCGIIPKPIRDLAGWCAQATNLSNQARAVDNIPGMGGAGTATEAFGAGSARGAAYTTALRIAAAAVVLFAVLKFNLSVVITGLTLAICAPSVGMIAGGTAAIYFGINLLIHSLATGALQTFASGLIYTAGGYYMLENYAIDSTFPCAIL